MARFRCALKGIIRHILSDLSSRFSLASYLTSSFFSQYFSAYCYLLEN